MNKIIKIVKYFLATTFVFLMSGIIGQKNSTDYSFVSLVHADICGGLPGDSGGSGGDSGPSDTGTSDTGGVGVDGTSDSDGPGDGSSTG